MAQFTRLHIGNFNIFTWTLLILAGVFECNFIAANVLCPRVNNLKEIFLPLTENCDYFVSCGKFSEKILKCPDGLKFDAIRKICDFPEKVICQSSLHKIRLNSPGIDHSGCPAVDPSHPIMLPHESDCGRFYICSHGLAYEQNCAQGLHFNMRLKVCDYPKDAKCIKKFPEIQSKNDRVQKCSQVNSYLPHKSDCGLFYVCESGIFHERRCANGLHFNPKLMVCDFPETAGCKHGFPTPGYRAGITEVQEMRRATGFPSPMCPKINGQYPVFFRDTENCSIYYMCGNGLAYKFTCPSGLHFNLRKKVCDDPSRAGCRKGQDGETNSS